MREQKAIGRPREFDEAEALAAIMNVFWAKGYEATSLADLVAATGLKKGSLYAAFGEKRSMYLKALAHYEAAFVESAAGALRAGGNAKARIRSFLSAPIEAAWAAKDFRGCFLCNASADQASLDPEIAKRVQRGFDIMEDGLAAALEDLGPKGKSERGRSARLLLSVYAGLRVMARAGVPRVRLEDARDAALHAVGIG